MADVAFREDTIVYPSLVNLASCLCLELEASGLPTPCLCAVVPGPEAVMDACGSCADGKCGGQAWVRMTSAGQSTNFPTIDFTADSCTGPLMWTVEVGVSRCAPVGTNSPVRGYTPPTMSEYLDAVRLQMADMAAMRRAIQCCFATDELSYILGVYQPLSVTGDCQGGTWTVQVSEIGS